MRDGKLKRFINLSHHYLIWEEKF